MNVVVSSRLSRDLKTAMSGKKCDCETVTKCKYNMWHYKQWNLKNIRFKKKSIYFIIYLNIYAIHIEGYVCRQYSYIACKKKTTKLPLIKSLLRKAPHKWLVFSPWWNSMYFIVSNSISQLVDHLPGHFHLLNVAGNDDDWQCRWWLCDDDDESLAWQAL